MHSEDPESQPLRSTPSVNLDSPINFTNKSVFRTRTSTAPVAPTKLTNNNDLLKSYELDQRLKKRALRYTCCSCMTGLFTGWIIFHAKAK